jgi:hypothetical protein
MSSDEDRQFASGLGRLMAGWGGQNGNYFYHTNDPTRVLSYVHYSDPHFNSQRTIYGPLDAQGLTWVDSWNLPRDDGKSTKQAREQLGLPENM